MVSSIARGIFNCQEAWEMNNKKVLIVIDMQNDFVTGALENREAQGITAALQDRLKEYKAE